MGEFIKGSGVVATTPNSMELSVFFHATKSRYLFVVNYVFACDIIDFTKENKEKQCTWNVNDL